MKSAFSRRAATARRGTIYGRLVKLHIFRVEKCQNFVQHFIPKTLDF
jgi:hypothetical protein